MAGMQNNWISYVLGYLIVLKKLIKNAYKIKVRVHDEPTRLRD